MEIFKLTHWYDRRFDGRRKEFRGITREAFERAKRRHYGRLFDRATQGARGRDIIGECRHRREVLDFFASIPYSYQGDGLDDFNKFQRPASNGVGYVAICPGESGNNYYTDDALTVRYLKAKYLKR